MPISVTATEVARNFNGVMAVSYTHLDVYKRQGEQEPGEGENGAQEELPKAA